MGLSKIDKTDVKIMALFFILSCVFFWKVILNSDKVIFAEYFSDIISYSLPIKTFIHDSWQDTGRLPLWNPYTFMGNPSAGNTQYAMFHPHNLLHLLLQPANLFGFLFLLDVFLIGTFTYFFVKSIGVNRFGATVSAIVFMFSGVVIARVYAGHPINLDIITMIPLSFLVVEVAMQKRNLFYGALAGIPIGLQLFGGNIQLALYSLTALGIYFVLRFFSVITKRPKDATKLISIMAIAGIVAISLSAVQLIPSLELSRLSTRSTMNYETATAYSFPPEQSLTFLMPEFFGTYLDYTYWGGRNFWELCVYTGVFSIVLTIIALINVKNEYKATFLLLLIFSFLFALGRYFPLYSIFYRFVPFFGIFRKPAVMLFLLAFSISVLSGLGADLLTKPLNMKCKRKLSILIKTLIILSLLTLIITLSVYALKERIMSIGKELLVKKYEFFTTQVHALPYELQFYIDKIPEVYLRILDSSIIFLITLSIITTFLYLRVRKKIKIKHFQLAVLIIILLDLWFFGMKYIDVIEPETIFSRKAITELLENDTQQFRVLELSGTLPHYVSMMYHVETIAGYDPIQLQNYRNFIDYFFGNPVTNERDVSLSLDIEEDKVFNNSKMLGILNVKYVLVRRLLNASDFTLRDNITATIYVKSLSNYQYKVNRGGYMPSNLTTQAYLYENNNFLPRAFIVRNARVANDEDILKEMESDNFDPREMIILEKTPNAPLVNSGTYKQADVIYYSPNEIEVQVYMDEPGFLVLSENYYPGWKATDNGKETEIYRTNYILRSVYLNKGQHTVKFVYSPVSFRIGLWITIITALLLSILVLYRIKTKVQKGKVGGRVEKWKVDRI